jgi:hypothetical protein
MADQHKGNQQTHTGNLKRLGISYEQCFDYLKRYIRRDQPGLLRFYNNEDEIKEAATQAMAMVNQLWNDGEGCTAKPTCMQVLVLYDTVILIGTFLINQLICFSLLSNL